MMVTVHLFARAKELAGCDRVLLAIHDGTVVADVRRELERSYPAMAALVQRSAFALYDDLVDDACPVPEWAELSLLPPVSGG